MEDRPYAQQQSAFWENYTRGRAKIPPSFWKRIFTYHTNSPNQSARYDTACDLGSGPGIYSSALAAKFHNVILIDPGARSLDIAKSIFSPSNSSSDRFTYMIGTAEENALAAESCDLTFAANMLHHTDTSRSIGSIASKLRPGGTFIATFSGLPQFTNPKIRDIWWRMSDHRVTRIREACATAGPDSPYSKMNAPLMIETQDSGYDSVAIPHELFEDITRWKLNADIVADAEPFRMGQGLRGEYPLVSRVKPGEKVIQESSEDWTFSMDLDAFRALVESFPFKRLDEKLMGKLWEETEEVAREFGRFDGFYAVSTIMARRGVSA